VFIPVLFMSGILAAVQGIRRDHLRGDSDFGRSLHHNDTHALQPVLRPPKRQKEGRMLNRLLGVYGWSLRWVLRHRPVMAGIFLVLLRPPRIYTSRSPRDSSRSGQRPDVREHRAAQGTSYEEMSALQQRVNDIIRLDPISRRSSRASAVAA